MDVVLNLDFGRGGNAETHLGSGWSVGEAGYRWMLDQISELWLERPREPGDYLLQFEMHPFIEIPALSQQSLSVTVRGIELGRVVLRQSGPVTWRIPSLLLKAPGPVRVILRHEDGRRPCDVKNSGDKRVLSFAAHSLRLLQASARKPNAGVDLPTTCASATELLGFFESFGDDAEFARLQHRHGAPVSGPVGIGRMDVRALLRKLRDEASPKVEPGLTRIAVIKREPEFSEPEVLPVLAALNDRYDALLWVSVADGAHPPGSVDEVLPGLLHGYVDSFSLTESLDQSSTGIWLEVCRKTLSIVGKREIALDTQEPAGSAPHVASNSARKPVVAFLGNCQLAMLARVYEMLAPEEHEYEVAYIPAFERATTEQRAIVADAEILVQQVLDFAPRSGHLPTGGRVVLVPHVTGAFMWPYSGNAHPKNRPEPTLDESGPYPPELGDSFLNRQIEASATPEQALQRYLETDVAKIRHLDRLAELVLDRQKTRDAECGFDFSCFIEARFQEVNLFRSPNHPDTLLAHYLILSVLPRLGISSMSISELLNHDPALFPRSETPIHPNVARHFRLQFMAPGRRYQFFEEGAFDFSEYVVRYMSYEWNRPLADALCKLRSGALEIGMEELKSLLDTAPRSAMARFALSEAMLRLGHRKEATRFAREALSIEPGNTHYARRAEKLLACSQMPEGVYADL